MSSCAVLSVKVAGLVALGMFGQTALLGEPDVCLGLARHLHQPQRRHPDCADALKRARGGYP